MKTRPFSFRAIFPLFALLFFSLHIRAEKLTVGVGEDYNSLAEALSAAEAENLTGDIEIEMMPGNYLDQTLISSYFAPPRVNSLRIFSNAEEMDAVELSYKAAGVSDNYTLKLDGCSNVEISNIRIVGMGSTHATSVWISGNSSNININSCLLVGSGIAEDKVSQSVVLIDDRFTQSDITISDCEIEGGSFGIFGGGKSKLEINRQLSVAGNIMTGQSRGGMYLKYISGLNVQNNVVNSLEGLESFAGLSLFGIENGLLVEANIIHFEKGLYGIHMADAQGTVSEPGLIKNNSISLGMTPMANGFFLEGQTDNLVLDFNRVKFSPGLRDPSNFAFYKNLSSGEHISMVNNIFYNLDSGGYTTIGNTMQKHMDNAGQSGDNYSTENNVLYYEKVR